MSFSFEEILAVFDDPFFLEAYDHENSTLDEIHWKGIYFFISCTERDNRSGKATAS